MAHLIAIVIVRLAGSKFEDPDLIRPASIYTVSITRPIIFTPTLQKVSALQADFSLIKLNCRKGSVKSRESAQSVCHAD